MKVYLKLTLCRTIFQSQNSWPMSDCCDPPDGWPLEEVEATLSGTASADIYEKLYYFVHGMLVSFLSRILAYGGVPPVVPA